MTNSHTNHAPRIVQVVDEEQALPPVMLAVVDQLPAHRIVEQHRTVSEVQHNRIEAEESDQRRQQASDLLDHIEKEAAL